MNPFSLENRNIVITGAASGIGRQCAVTCAAMGARLILFDLNQEGLEATVELVERKNEHYLCVTDLTDYKKVSQLLAEAVEKSGRINGLLNCAGISNTLPLKSATPELVEKFFRINVLTGYFMTKEVTKMGNLSKEGASIVFFSSVAGSFGQPGKSIYGMTKGALVAGTKSLACELAPKKVRVNAISPGVVITPINANLPHIADPEKRKETENLHLLGLGETTDIANACVYLLSDASKWVTGTNLFIDGGYSAK